MPQVIEIDAPGEGLVELEFPDDMSEDAMRSAIYRNFPALNPEKRRSVAAVNDEPAPTPSTSMSVPMPSTKEGGPRLPPRDGAKADQNTKMLEADNLSKRFRMAMELTQDPIKQQRLRDDFNKQLKGLGIDPISFQPDVVQAALTPSIDVPPELIIGPLGVMVANSDTTAGKVVRGAARGTAHAASAMTSPLGVATLGQGALPRAMQRGISGAFAADMGRHIPGQVSDTVKALKEGDIEGAAEHGTGALLNSVFTGMAARHANRPAVPVPLIRDAPPVIAKEITTPQMTAEVIKQAEPIAPRSAAALKDLTGQPELTKAEAFSKGGEPELRIESVADATDNLAGRTDRESLPRTTEVVAEPRPDLDPAPPAPETPRPAETTAPRTDAERVAAFDEQLTSPEATRQIEFGLRAAGLLDGEIPDAIQGVIERVLEREASGKGFDASKASLPTYLNRVARTHAIDLRRAATAEKRGGTQEKVSLDQEVAEGVTIKESIVDDAAAPRGEVAIKERNEILRSAIDRLPADEQKVAQDFLAGAVSLDDVRPSTRAKLRKILEGELSVDAAAIKSAGAINEVIQDFINPNIMQYGSGLPGWTMGSKVQTLPPVGINLKSVDPKVESRWQKAHGIGSTSFWQRIKSGTTELAQNFRRHFPKLDPNQDGQVMDILRQFEATPVYAKELAAQALKSHTAGFAKDHLNVFERVVILRDLLRDVESGQYAGKEIPFGYPDEAAIRSDLTRFNELADATPGLRDAIARRDTFMETLRNNLVNYDLLPESVLERGDYFHRQALEYMRLRDIVATGTGSAEVRKQTKGFQHQRTHSSKDYNTSYLEAEFEVVSQALAQINTVETLAKIDKAANIRTQLEAFAKDAAEGSTWKDFIPQDHTVWQPKRGNVMYWVQSLSDRIVEQVLSGEKLLEAGDLKDTLAVGGRRTEWVIPKRLAETLDDYKPKQDDNVVGRASSWTMGRWKQWTLLNPLRATKYMLNNMTGDMDIVTAWNPKVFKEVPGAYADSANFRMKGKAPTAEQVNAIKKGLIGSDFFVQEVPDVSKHRLFKTMTGENLNVIEKYWGGIEKFNLWREDVLRLATYRFVKKELEAGKKVYGASRKAEVDKIPDLDDRAVKIARELIGDYGNISRAGQWMRRHVIPFYSWMEINAPRYVRLMRNIAKEDATLSGAGKRITGVVAKRSALKAATFTAKATALYALVSLWNKSFFPEEDEEVNKDRNQLHLILGREADGNVRSIRFQGALSDALSWFGLEDIVNDTQKIAEGKKSLTAEFMEAGLAPVNKLANSSFPMIKTAAEAGLGLSTYPDLFEVREGKDGAQVKVSPTVVRDRKEHIAQLFSMKQIYRYLADRPSPGISKDIASLVTYSTDPGQSAYYASRQIVSDYLAKLGEDHATVIPTEKQNALYYHKQALRYGDKAMAERWKKRYMEMGGNEKGMAQSIAKSHPLSSLSKKKQAEFYENLSPEDAAIIEKAIQWYDKVYNAQ